MNQSMKSGLIWGGVILGIVALVWLLATLGSGDAGSGGDQTLGDTVKTTDHIQGPTNAKVTLVEYSDFECPACGAMYPIVKQLSQDFPDTLAVVYRHFPLKTIHPNAMLASQAAEAASIQGNFWEMHDVLFNTQKQWEGLTDPTDFFVSLATSLGLYSTQFKTDLTSSSVETIVNESYNRASAMKLQGTPTFFLNGDAIQNPGSYQAFKILIQSTLDAQ